MWWSSVPGFVNPAYELPDSWRGRWQSCWVGANPRRARPPLVPEGEPVLDPEQIIAGIDPRPSSMRLPSAPTGACSGDNTLRLWDPATGRMLGILFWSRDGLWVSCRVDTRHCRRYDDSTLLIRRDESGGVTPIPFPAGFEPAELVVESSGSGEGAAAPALLPGDGESVPVFLQVHNPGPETAYWLRVYQERTDGDPFLFTPPTRRVRLGPGETWEATGAVSHLAAGRDRGVWKGT